MAMKTRQRRESCSTNNTWSPPRTHAPTARAVGADHVRIFTSGRIEVSLVVCEQTLPLRAEQRKRQLQFRKLFDDLDLVLNVEVHIGGLLALA